MKLFASFRARFLFGALVASAGLLLAAHVASVLLFIGSDTFRGASHIALLLAAAAVFIVAGLGQARNALSSLNELRARLTDVREGTERRLEGSYPTEVQPLVDDLNALLEHREQRVRDALAKAGDLAHGLKTPLAVLAHEAERAEAAGHRELAATLTQQIDRMRKHVDYHLAHARAAASGATLGARCQLSASAEALGRTLQRLHAERGVTILVNVPPEHIVRAEREDVDEMLGNLLDNACKWARSRVAVSSSNGAKGVEVTVDDDGPGLARSMREAVLQRGVRADEAAPGSGFGLAIVRDLVELHGGSIALEDAPLGGLRAKLLLPAARGLQGA